ncbi:hypothetical protein AB7C87_10420 [Natrarchaeobius sp. A-rgal3]
MAYSDYAESGTKCALCGKKTFGQTISVDGEEVCSSWCETEYERRSGEGS